MATEFTKAGERRLEVDQRCMLGYWINNRLNGPGTEIRCNGVKYVGNFVNGTINGRGTFTLSNGAEYSLNLLGIQGK